MSIFTKNSTNKNEKGFSVVEILLVLVLLGAIVFAGFYVYNRQKDDSADTSSQESTQQQPPEINDSEDLQSSEDNLNDINIEELNTDDLDEAEADLL